MLTIPFSHFYRKMPNLYVLGHNKTYLRGYTVVNKLSQEFIEYDTAIATGGNFQLPRKGPYLILFLETINCGWVAPHKIRWTTVRLPWKRQAKGCPQCRKYPCGVEALGKCFGWRPHIPPKYRYARGKEVKIVIEERR